MSDGYHRPTTSDASTTLRNFSVNRFSNNGSNMPFEKATIGFDQKD